MRALLAISVVALAATAHGQEPLGRSIAIEDPSGTVLPRIQRALASAGRGDGVARIAFWGASHTASDQYGGALRALLQRRYGDAGAGLVMPARPFPLYDRRDVVIDESTGWRGVAVRGDRRTDHYGRAGFAIDSTVRAHARIRADAAHVELWAMTQPHGGALELSIDGATPSRLETSAPEAGLAYATADVARGRHRVDVRADGPARVFGVLLETGAPGVIVETFGVPGARARDQLAWDEATLRAHVARRPPDLVALAYGTNESGDRQALAEVDADLRAVLARWHRVAPDAACLLIGPSDWPRELDGTRVARPRTTAMRDLHRRAALASGCAFFDLLAFQGGAGSITRWVDAGLALSDHVHVTDAAHERLAAVLDRAIRGAR